MFGGFSAPAASSGRRLERDEVGHVRIQGRYHKCATWHGSQCVVRWHMVSGPRRGATQSPAPRFPRFTDRICASALAADWLIPDGAWFLGTNALTPPPPQRLLISEGEEWASISSGSALLSSIADLAGQAWLRAQPENRLSVSDNTESKQNKAGGRLTVDTRRANNDDRN